MDRFVAPETRVLTLANGDTLVVKKRLNRGEKAEMFAFMRPPGVFGIEVDRTRVGLARMCAYVIDWQLAGRSTPILDLPWAEKATVFDSLDPDDFDEMLAAVYKHEDAVQAERDAAKKAQSGGRPSPATSPSASSSAGATSGSES